SKVVESLLTSIPASELAVSVRDPEKAEGLRARGIEVRKGDFNHPETLNDAIKGIERLLIISADGDNDTRIRQHTNAVQAAER
ncbi:NAD(P)H-binding protein, partial [Bacillus sp. GbtcB15]|uniref:NAD(P)H-binding protein n=1 Tax=Bacillus sp. GbtcB15 TaxID=2824760 RepID=UPI001C301260